jgi:hypothetical protein
MKVWFFTKPLAKFTCRWAEPGIAGMSLMDLITSKRHQLVENVGHKNINPPGNTTTFWTGIDVSVR